MRIHETTRADGSLSPITLDVVDGVLALVHEGEALPLPEGALDAVMTCLGKELDPKAKLVEVDALDVGEARLRHVRHLAIYDVIALDYLVYDAPGREPLCALATNVAGVLGHLGRVAQMHRR
jgi:hypothetical protein